MKVRHGLARRMAASYACAKRDAAWWLGFGLPDGQVLPLPLLGRCVWASSRVVPPQGIRPARLAFDVPALRAEVDALASETQRRADAHVSRLKASGFYDLPGRPAAIPLPPMPEGWKVGETEYHDHGEGAGYPWPPEWVKPEGQA